MDSSKNRRTMPGIIVMFTALLHCCVSDPRTPRVYNVLISSKKNLVPSQALPVYEPVLRTTSVGLAFPPLYYTSLNPGQDYITEYTQSLPLLNQNEFRGTGTVEIQKEQNIPTTNDNGFQNNPAPNAKGLPSNVIPLQQYLPLYPTNLKYQPFHPKPDEHDSKAEPANTGEEDFPGNFEKIYDNNNPKQIVANLKRNPEIPDVPPPPLPVRTNFNT